MNYSIGTWKGDLSSLSGFSATVGGHSLMGVVDATFARGSGGVDATLRSGMNTGYGVFGFLNYTWELDRGYF